MTIAEIIRNGKSTAGSNSSWKVTRQYSARIVDFSETSVHPLLAR